MTQKRFAASRFGASATPPSANAIKTYQTQPKKIGGQGEEIVSSQRAVRDLILRLSVVICVILAQKPNVRWLKFRCFTAGRESVSVWEWYLTTIHMLDVRS